MLSINDYNHIKTLYEQFRQCNGYIRSLIEADDWDSVENAVQEKNAILRKIIFFEKPRLDDIKENEELNKIRLELIELEKKNIEIVKSMKEALSKEISKVHQTNVVRNTYEPAQTETISTLEIIDFE